MMAYGESLDIVKNMAAIERLKCNMLTELAALFDAMSSSAGQADVQEHLAELLIDNFLLAERLGVGFDGLELEAYGRLKLKQDDSFRNLRKYLSGRIEGGRE